MKVAFAHDFIRQGGAERVLEQFFEIWPGSPVYTLLDERHPEYAHWEVRSSWLQGLLPKKRYRWPFFYYPRLVDRTVIEPGIDLLVSSSVSWVKNLTAPPGVPHLCYLHSPMRFAYAWQQREFFAQYPRLLHPLLRRMCEPIRAWDVAKTHHADLIVSNSHYTANKVKELYGRESPVLHVPVGTKRS